MDKCEALPKPDSQQPSASELIVRFGFNVDPAEVEAVVSAHPAVVRSAVIGRPVERADGDEGIVAFVQRLPGSPLTANKLAEHAARYLAPYKRPSQVLSIPAMPVTSIGKIAKDELSKNDLPTAITHGDDPPRNTYTTLPDSRAVNHISLLRPQCSQRSRCARSRKAAVGAHGILYSLSHGRTRIPASWPSGQNSQACRSSRDGRRSAERQIL